MNHLRILIHRLWYKHRVETWTHPLVPGTTFYCIEHARTKKPFGGTFL